MVKLTDEQESVKQEILKFGKPIQRLGGVAGSGKTTVISHLIEDLPEFAVCAFTGKAANVLRKKGIDASTIHSLIYKPMLDHSGKIVIRDGSPVFVLATELDCDGIIVDEASMVSKEIYKDLCSFNIPLIFVGDHGQLEPVGEGINVMAQPDFVLETVHRNAGEIAFFAEHIRNGNNPMAWRSGGKVIFMDKMSAWENYREVDQIICAYNATRVAVNQAVRKMLGYTGTMVVGERIMCLRNSKTHFLFNGMQGFVKDIVKRNKIVFSANEMDLNVSVDKHFFNCEKYDFTDIGKDGPHPFDYAYCITAHKSQGDEWPVVMVLEQKCKNWSHVRWSYTCASRAKEKLIWVSC